VLLLGVLLMPGVSRAQLSGDVLFEVSAAVPPSVPQPVEDLSADVGVSTAQVEGRLLLAWTAPDGYTPPEGEPAAKYLVRYATFSVADVGGDPNHWWNTASFKLELTTPPAYPGTAETLILDRLEPGALLYFAIRSTNSVAPTLLSPLDLKTASGTPTSARVPNFAPPPPLSVRLERLCGRVRLSWDPIDTNVTYDFDHYRPWRGSSDLGEALAPIGASTGTRTASFETAKDLANFTSYQFQIRSYDLRGLESTYYLTLTSQSYAVATNATDFRVTGSSLAPVLVLDWANPANPLFKGGILVRTNPDPITAAPVDFSSYTAGNTLGNATVLAAWTSGSEVAQYVDTNLAAGTTYYYYVFNFYQEGPAYCYSSGVSGSIVIQDRPMAPAAVDYTVDSQGLAYLDWSPVRTFANGREMTLGPGGYPIDLHLFGYNVYKSTCGAGGCGGANPWTRLNTSAPVPKSTPTYLLGGAAVFENPKTFFVVRAANSFAFESADSNSVDSSRQLYAVAKVGDAVIAEAAIPPALKEKLKAANNPEGVDLQVAIVIVPEEQTGSVLRSIQIRVLRADSGALVQNYVFSGGTHLLSISNTGLAGTRGQSAQSVGPTQNPNLDIFWFNGVRWIPMNGSVNAQTETVTIQTSLTGKFQLRNVARATQDLLPRVITPNGDGLNDRVFFNTKVPGVTGKIFDIRGAKVADLQECPSGTLFGSTCLYWDGKAGGKGVHSGIYIYDLNGQGKHFTGTIVVAQ